MDFLGLHKMQTDNFLNPEKENKYGVLAAFYIKSLTTPCLIFLGHFAMSTPTFFKFHQHFLYFTRSIINGLSWSSQNANRQFSKS
jgi:hypothetical protein